MSYIKEFDYTIDKRSNRYLEAIVDWSSYPQNIGLAIRGNSEIRDSANKSNCGSLKYSFVPVDNLGKIYYAFHNCHKLSCGICGMPTSYRDAKRMSFRILKLKNCGWHSIRFLSMNIDMDLDIFRFRENESFYSWLKRVRKIVVKHLKDNGMKGFYTIFHPDRLEKFNNQFEIRSFDPHFHVIGIGKMTNSNEFYQKYGYTYRTQKSIKFNNKKQISEQLAGRVAYRLNHCGFSYNPSGRQSNAYIGYGLLANNMIKILDEIKQVDKVLSENGSEIVAKDLTDSIKSSKPKRIRVKMNEINNRMVIDIKNTGYPRVKDEHDFIMFEKMIFDINLEVDESWRKSNPETILSFYTNEPIYLKEVELIQKVRVKGYSPLIVSSNQLVKDKEPRFYLLRDFDKSIENVNIRFNELKSLRLALKFS